MAGKNRQPEIRLTLLGGFQLRDGAGTELSISSKKAKALLAYLALQTGQAQPREKLATLLWDGRSDEQARQSLRQALAALRKVIPETVIRSEGDCLLIDQTCLNSDVGTFEYLTNDTATDALAQAVGLYQGELLEGLNPRAELFEEWLLTERLHLREKALELMQRLLSVYLEAERDEEAIQLALRLLSLDPLREQAHRILMQLYTRRGNLSAALKQYRQCRRVLQRELGITPENETEQLHEQLLEQRKHSPRSQQEETQTKETTQAELRQAAVVCLRLTGYSDAMSPEDLHTLLNRYYEIVDEEVVRQGGTIAKHFGELVMAFFGIPHAHDDDNWRALKLAKILRQLLADTFNEEQLQIQIGLANGQVFAGELGSNHIREFSVVGQAVTTAEELSRQASAGQLLVSDNFYHAIAAHVDACQSTANAWQINALLAQQKAAHALIGRTRELHLLSSALEECQASEQGEAFFIRGEAGIGKTRLVESFSDLAHNRGFFIHEGICRSLAASTQTVIQTLVNDLVEHLTQDDIEGIVTAEQRPFLLDLMGQTLEPAEASLFDAMDVASRRDRRQTVLNALIEATTEQKPLVLVVEDIHWADSETLRQLASLVQMASRLPLLVVMSSRVEGEPLDPAWRGAMQGARLTTLDLTRLRDKEMLALANTVSKDPSLIQRCVERADGNPFFLLQLLQGIDNTSAQLPSSIQLLVLAQLDRLSPEDRRVAHAAAVLGQRLSLSTLRYLLEDESYQCDGLVRAGLLRPEQAHFAFCHALIQECVYRSLVKAQLNSLHQRAADWYAKRDLVLHAEHLDRANDPAAAAAYLTAAQTMMAQFKLSRAQTLLQQGLALNSEQTFSLAQMLGELLRETGEINEAMHAFEQALDAAKTPVEQSRALIGKAACQHLRDQYQPALTSLGQAEELITKENAVEQQAWIVYLRGNILFPLGRLEECLASHSQALDLAQQCDSLELEARALSGLGDAYYLRGQMATAHTYFSQCVDLCRNNGFKRIEVSNLSMRGLTAMYLNQLREGIQDNLDCTELAQTIGNRRAELGSRDILGMMFYFLGELNQAQQHLEAGIALAQLLGARRFEAECYGYLACVAHARGEQTGAEALVERAWKLCGDDLAYMGGWLLGEMARITRDSHKRQWALNEGERILAAGAVSHNYIHFYENAIHTSIREEAWEQVTHYTEALQVYTAKESLPWAELIIQLGRISSAQGCGEKVSPQLNKLRQTFHSIGIHHADGVFDQLGRSK